MAKYYGQTRRMGRQRFRHRAEQSDVSLTRRPSEVTGAAEHLEIVRRGVATLRPWRLVVAVHFLEREMLAAARTKPRMVGLSLPKSRTVNANG